MEQHPTISSRKREQARAWLDQVNVEMDSPPQNEGGMGAADIATTSNHPLDQSRSAENPNIRVPSLPNLEMVMQENHKLKAMLESLMQQLGMAAPPPPQPSPPLQPPQSTQQTLQPPQLQQTSQPALPTVTSQPRNNPNSSHEKTQEVHVTEQRHDAQQLNTSFEGTMVSQRAMIEQIIEAKMAEQNEGSATYDLYKVPYPVHHLFKKLPTEHPKVPKFSKSNGDGSPHEHIAHYTSIMGELATEESYLLRYFSTSLTGPAFQWYARLKPNSIVGWEDMQRKFFECFRVIERRVTLAELISLKQNKNESALDFIKRWRDMSMKCEQPLAHDDAVKLCQRSLKPEIKEKLLEANIRTFEHLNNTVAEIEIFFAENPTTVFGKGKLPKDKGLGSREVNVVVFSSALGKKGGKGEASAPSNTKKNEKGSTLSLAERLSAPYSFTREHTKELLDICLQENLITLPEPKRPEEATMVDKPNYCAYHRMLGHTLETCYLFKNRAEKLIQARVIDMAEYLVNPPQPHQQPKLTFTANVIQATIQTEIAQVEQLTKLPGFDAYQQLPNDMVEKAINATFHNQQEEAGWTKVNTSKRSAPKKPQRKQQPRKLYPGGATPPKEIAKEKTLQELAVLRKRIKNQKKNKKRKIKREATVCETSTAYEVNGPLKRLQGLIDELEEYQQMSPTKATPLEKYIPWEELEHKVCLKKWLMELREHMQKDEGVLSSVSETEVFWGTDCIVEDLIDKV
ncbi:hypothetical protein Taro_024877 [Colocasia esculenta]|uniref:Retrotransposon gag domain-containing protein n=1 Tax=Colocasia esculenta TaxID=4460 RepID=A0A843VFU1_COLES|nr:hypothetical protein [Colocasia esculenta]